ncbi:PD-(D/E)XK nuclease family protein [Aureispira sp. CCB-QB1]|uniref:PD-(D/E)XK nuclease family protein n=1 Tax=Aureispira sp. CCB-QB1 TaxID=1313421 RepID=UPI0018CC4645|nr:PD-(D/E)XK nuclease family protein [Aureispira sp. CCB-QB1]
MNSKAYTELLDFSDEIFNFLKLKTKNKSFDYNILESLKVNENAHSIILSNILQYQDFGFYTFLKSFFEYLSLDLKVETPIITSEESRIDILIKDSDYAVIIENKIHFATDQEEQIDRYIQKVQQLNYPKEKIYVLYLTRNGGSPPISSFSTKNRKIFESRYFEINYMKDIFPWIKDEVLQKCRIKDKIFVNSLTLYLDYLERLLNIRKKDKKMNSEIKNKIKEKLSLKGNLKEDEIILSEKLEQLSLLTNHINDLLYSITAKLRKNFIEDLYQKLNSQGNDWVPVKLVNKKATIEDANHKNFGFRYQKHLLLHNQTEVKLSIEIQDFRKFICGVFTHNDSDLKDFLYAKFEETKLQNRIDSSSNWIFLKLDEYDYNSTKIGWNVYENSWNQFYIDDMSGVVNTFYDNILEVKKVWDELCK